MRLPTKQFTSLVLAIIPKQVLGAPQVRQLSDRTVIYDVPAPKIIPVSLFLQPQEFAWDASVKRHRELPLSSFPGRTAEKKHACGKKDDGGCKQDDKSKNPCKKEEKKEDPCKKEEKKEDPCKKKGPCDK